MTNRIQCESANHETKAMSKGKKRLLKLYNIIVLAGLTLTTAWKSERKSRVKTTKNPSFRLWSLRHPAKESKIALGAQDPLWTYQ